MRLLSHYTLMVCLLLTSASASFGQGSSYRILKVALERQHTPVAFSPNGKELLAGYNNGTIGIWNTETGVLKAHYKLNAKKVLAVSFSNDGNRIGVATATTSGLFLLTRVPNGWDIKSLNDSVSESIEAEFLTLKFSKNDTHVYFMDSPNRSLYAYHILSGKWKSVFNNKNPVYLADFTSYSGAIHCYKGLSCDIDPASEKVAEAWFNGFDGPCPEDYDSFNLSYSSLDWFNSKKLIDNQSVLSTSWSPSGVRDTTREFIEFVDRLGTMKQSVMLSASGQLLAAADAVGSLSVWRTSDGFRLLTISKPKQHFNCVAIAHNETRLVAATFENQISLYDIKKGVLLHSFPNTKEAIMSLAISNDGSQLAIGTANGDVILHAMPGFASDKRVPSKGTSNKMRVLSELRTD